MTACVTRKNPNRRTLVVSMAVGAAMVSARPARAVVTRKGAPRVIVVGAGAMGASIAYHLARRGARVTVLEKSRPGDGGTQGAFAMLISVHDGDTPAFNALYGSAIEDWRRIERELAPGVQVQWGGELAWAPAGDGAEQIGRSARQLQAWDAPIRLIDPAELRRLAPGLEPGPVAAASFAPNSGALDPMQALRALVGAARARGVAFRYPCRLRSFRTSGDRIVGVTTSDGALDADMVVLATGADTPALAGEVGVRTPIDVVSGTLAHSSPLPRALGRVLVGPAGSLKQDPDGRVVIGPDYRPSAHGTDTSAEYGARLLAEAGQVLPGLAGARLEAMTLGYVAIPKDTLPIVGFCSAPSNLYVALTMSGITMAPLMGRLAAAEIAGGAAAPELAPYRPARFA